jgi:hypothetical protein
MRAKQHPLRGGEFEAKGGSEDLEDVVFYFPQIQGRALIWHISELNVRTVLSGSMSTYRNNIFNYR